jgi:hypothetical protein
LKKQDFAVVFGISIVLAGIVYGANLFEARSAGIGFAALIFLMPLVSFFALSWGIKMGLDVRSAAGVVVVAAVIAYVIASLSFGVQMTGPPIALLCALLVPPAQAIAKTVVS